MSVADDSRGLPPSGSLVTMTLRRVVASPRLYVYLSCTILAVVVSYFLGKEMLWDTMDYHVYAGFSALHHRFRLDYFAAGPQSYFNPYAYVPFYLLIRSSLTPLQDASILAALQSVLLWLSYELALTLAPSDKTRVRVTIGIAAVAFAFADPVLIYEIGSSYADITTAVLALGGWVLLAKTIRRPGFHKNIWAGVLLGAASALKMTNAVHAVAALALVAFIPGSWRDRARHGAVFAAGLAVSFVVVNLPWSIRLVQNFGNPLFPLLNRIFRSPEFSTGPMVAYRFVPQSFAAGLLRPFTMALPSRMIDVEWTAPDLRYAILVVLALLLLVLSVCRRIRRPVLISSVSTHGEDKTKRVTIALGCAFVVDWALWLTASGNGRYLIPMASVAAVLDVVLIFRLFPRQLRARNYLLLAVVGAQIFQSCMGTEYRPPIPWHRGSWVNLSIPPQISSQPDLYFLMGEQTNSFVVPYLPQGSGFINLDGEYGLGPKGANGMRIRHLIERFNPHLRVLMVDNDGKGGLDANLSPISSAANALRMFGLAVDVHHCAEIVARGVSTLRFSTGRASQERQQQAPMAPNTESLVTCRLVWNGTEGVSTVPGEHAANLAFNHLEESCPALFQPAHPLDRFTGDRTHGYVFSRRYANAEMLVWIAKGRIRFAHFFGGLERSAGTEREWEQAPLRVTCGRSDGGFLRLEPARAVIQ